MQPYLHCLRVLFYILKLTSFQNRKFLTLPNRFLSNIFDPPPPMSPRAPHFGGGHVINNNILYKIRLKGSSTK